MFNLIGVESKKVYFSGDGAAVNRFMLEKYPTSMQSVFLGTKAYRNVQGNVLPELMKKVRVDYVL